LSIFSGAVILLNFAGDTAQSQRNRCSIWPVLVLSRAGIFITAIKLFSFSYLVGWIDMCFSSLFTALGHPVQSLLVSFFGTLVFPIAFLFVLTVLWGLNGVWLMASTAAVASGILTLILAKTIHLQHPQIPSQS
jgi:Na+-driven multidrug efflux pump